MKTWQIVIHKIESMQGNFEADTCDRNFCYMGSSPSAQTLGSFLADTKYFMSLSITVSLDSEGHVHK